MSKFNPYRCPVTDCKIHYKIIYSEEGQFKGHLRDHDYTELLETSVKLHLILSLTERRSPTWLVDHIAIASIVKENVMEI